MNRLKTTFLLLLLYIGMQAQQPVIVSEYSYRHYTTQDGLPQMILYSIYQDKQGFIWVGGRTGISRYDGFDFKNYSAANFDGIFRLFEDKNGNVHGLDYSNLYTVNTAKNKLNSGKLSDTWEYEKSISEFLPAPYFLFSYYPQRDNTQAAIFKIEGNSMKQVFKHDSLNPNFNYSNKIHWDLKQKRLYLPNFSGVSVVNESGKLEAFWKDVFIFAFAETKKGMFAVGRKGIYQITGVNYNLVYPYDFDREVLVQLVEYGNGLIIKGTNTIYRYDSEVKVIFKLNVPVNEVLVDREQNLWAVTHKGLYNFFHLNFKNYSFPNDADVIRSAIVDKHGTLWMGTFAGKVYSLNQNQEVKNHDYVSRNTKSISNTARYFHAGCSYDSVQDVALFPGGMGVLVLKNGKNSWLQIPPDNYFMTKFLSDQRCLANQAYAFYNYNFSDGKYSFYDAKRNKQTQIEGFEEDGKGRIWMTGPQGVSIIGKDTTVLLSDSLINRCKKIIRDKEGAIWFSAGNKLFYVNNNDKPELVYTFQYPITNLFSYDTDKIIVGALSGFYVFNPKSKQYTYFDYQNGFTGYQPEMTPIFKDNEGKIWINTLRYLTCFDINSTYNQQYKPNLLITSVETSTNNVNWKNSELKNLKLNYQVKNLKIKYIGLLYSSASNVRYQYRLRGFQDEWSNPIAEREVTFNNLPPGQYIFELKCNAGTPETQTDVVSLPIYIKPAFWQTWLFKILVFLFLAGLIAWVAIRYQRKKHERELRKANREKEMNELRVQSVRLKSIPHFNSNVLAGIEYFIMTKSKEEANELLTTYSRFTNITLHDIDKAQRSLKDELGYVRMYLGLEKMRYGDKLNYEINVDENVDDKVMIPNMILHTLAENAIKHGIRGKNTAGKVQIKVVNENKGIRISVEDDGVGRTESAKRNAEQNRTGHGLSILSRQIELYNQQNDEKIEEKVVDLTNENGNATGTRFEMYVPYGYKYI